ncbi:MAG: carboxypeptidase regulatory-like domain-containing protein [Acidobacteria bacterium]|nr:carboxypeptidase regulatory-like domain-containing protein [Acidobacteriota bacterium]
MNLRTSCTAIAVLLSLACHPSRPVVDPGPRPDVGGSISGIVSASDGSPLGARKVVAVNTATGARVEASSTATGGYTMRVPPGTYRLEVETRPGETLAVTPDPTEVDPGDLDAGRNFVVARR